MYIIIDGYNMIRQSDTLRRSEKFSLEAGRNALIRHVSLYKKKKGHKITIVFDGWENGSPIEEHDFAAGVYIIYSKLGETADEVIKRIVRSKGEEIVVVTSDRDIADYVERKGGAVISPWEFEAKIGESQAGRESFIDKNDDNDNQFLEWTKKKGPSKRLSRKKKNDLARLKKL